MRFTSPLLFGLLVLVVLASGCAQADVARPDRPNIILIISDDHGFGDYGFMGSDQAITPNLDRLASESLVFSRGYMMPTCAPALGALLTGQYPHASGIFGSDLPGRIQDTDRSALAARVIASPLLLPRALSDSGYLTFQTGKLWNTSYHDVGFTHGMTAERTRLGGPGLRIGRHGMEPIREFLDLAMDDRKPFFIWYAPYIPHRPHNPPQRLRAKYKGRGPSRVAEEYLSMIELLDDTAGELDAMLVERGLVENTIVIYLADNGWAPDPRRRSGVDPRSKGSGYELGVRSPVLVRWPAKLQATRDDELPVSILDVVPTVLSAAGLSVPEDLPGVDLLDLEAVRQRDAIFLSVFTGWLNEEGDPVKCLRARVAIEGFWKLMLPGPEAGALGEADPTGPELYDLRNDPLEATDLASREPETVARLRQRMDAWWNPTLPSGS